MSSSSKKRILIINPNSSKSITSNIQVQLSPRFFGVSNREVELEFFTAPSDSPQSIDDARTDELSTAACLPALRPLVIDSEYDAFLVACYSDHSLVTALRQLVLTERGTEVPVIGILEASVWQAVSLLDEKGGVGKFGVVTTGKQWEPVLTEAILELDDLDPSQFAGVASSGLGVLELHSKSKEEVDAAIIDAVQKLTRQGGVLVVCLGCAGMMGMEEVVSGAFKAEDSSVKVVDGVVAGVNILCSRLGVASI